MPLGRMAERTKATVLKTVSGATRSWVRIPLLPPLLELTDIVFAFVVRHDGNVARFRIRNSRELTAEEHPWVKDLALALQRERIDVRGFRAP